MAKKVFVGMSGGVDSSVTAALLKEQGYLVTGVYMKNWTEDLPGMVCPWREDFEDAKRVAVKLGIPFKVYDFQKQYRRKVVDYMVAEYRAGRTPNPDIMCNQEIKFKLFLDTALEDGADMIATGHYSRIIPLRHPERSVSEAEGSKPRSLHFGRDDKVGLYAAVDKNKDQSYFLYRVNESALQKSLMPIGELTKLKVRELARQLGLSTAEKKDSQGICFVGKVGIKDFLLHELGEQPAGAVIDQNGKVVGEHEGALFYTIGQRHGLKVGGGLPFYVTGKNMVKNEVHVTTDLQDEGLWSSELSLTDIHWINQQPLAAKNGVGSRKHGQLDHNPYTILHILEAPTSLTVRTRYRAPLINCQSSKIGKTLKLKLAEDVRAVTPGQSAVIYDGDKVLGGGIVV